MLRVEREIIIICFCQRHHCSSPGGAMDGKIVVEDEAGELSDFTTVSWQIGLGETLCYRFSSESRGMSGTVEVTYLSLKSVYSIMDTYRFPLVRSQVSCLCDCPGGASHCHAGLDLCENKTNCANYYNPSVQSSGCFLQWLQLSAAVCCAIKVVPYNTNNNLHQAVRLGNPNVQAQFRTVLKNLSGEVVDSRIFTTDLNKGSALDWYLTLHLSSPGPASVLPGGWYLTSPHTPDLLLTGNNNLNGLNTWQVDRLGWAKLGPGGDLVTPEVSSLARRFVPRVENCLDLSHSGHFQGGQIDRDSLENSRDVRKEFRFVSAVRIWQRHVEVEHSESALVSLSLQHRSRVGVVVQFSSSHLQDFTGLLYQDSLSLLHLNLSLVEAGGTLTGEVTGLDQASQSFLVRLGPARGNSSHQVRLGGLECRARTVQVSLKPLTGEEEAAVVRRLPCLTTDLRTFSGVSGHHQVAVSGLERVGDCVLCLQSWSHWLHPAHWLDNVWTRARVVITIVTSLLIIIIILITVKILRSLCRLCNCTKNKQDKNLRILIGN